MRIVVALLGCFFLLAPSAARADVVGEEDPRVQCPPGSHRVTHHCGTVCEPNPCGEGSACPSGTVCGPVMICVASEPYCGIGDSDYDRVTGGCDVDSSCGAGECTPTMGCVAEGGAMDSGAPSRDSGAAPVDSGSSPGDSGSTAADTGPVGEIVRGCGCRVAGSSSGSGLGGPLGLAGVALALFARRRAAA